MPRLDAHYTVQGGDKCDGGFRSDKSERLAILYRGASSLSGAGERVGRCASLHPEGRDSFESGL